MTQLYELKRHFKQRDKTTYISIELLDRYMLDERNQHQNLDEKQWLTHLVTVFLIASKYDEIDD